MTEHVFYFGQVNRKVVMYDQRVDSLSLCSQPNVLASDLSAAVHRLLVDGFDPRRSILQVGFFVCVRVRVCVFV